MTALLPATTIAAAVAAQLSPVVDFGGYGTPQMVTAVAKFLYGAGGTTVKAWLQTSYDNVTWFDVKNFAFTTAAANKLGSLIPAAVASAVLTDGTLGDDLKIDGALGRYWRVKYTTTGTYSGATSVQVDIFGSA